MVLMEGQELKISSKSENLVLVEKMVDEICKDFQVNEDHYGNILVAITEAVSNAIYHGNKSNPEKNVNITFNSNAEALVFSVTDDGDGFDFDNLPDPTDPVNLEKPHGRGVFLMRNLADNIEFTEEGKTVELSFNL